MQRLFGVKRKDLLNESIKGKEHLNRLLNKGLDKTNESSDENEKFRAISKNICIFHSETYENNKNAKEENIRDAIVGIFKHAENAIKERISNMQTGDMDKFAEEFEYIKMHQLIIKYITENSINKFPKLEKEIRENIEEKHKQVDIRLRCIDEILRNDNIKNKSKLLQNLQHKKTMEGITQFMEDNNIILDLDIELPLSRDVSGKHNLEYASYGKEWDNTEVIQYMQENEKQINKFANLRKATKKIRLFLEKVLDPGKKDKIKLIPEKTQTTKREQHSWDLVNWGIDKEQFMQESQKNIKNNRELEQQAEQKTNIEKLEIQNAHEEI